MIVAPSPVPTLDTCRAAAPDRRGPEGQRAMPDEKTATSFMSVIDTACIRPWARGLREPDAALSCRSIGTCALAPGAARLQRPSDATHQDIQAADRRDRAINSLPLRVILGFVAHRGCMVLFLSRAPSKPECPTQQGLSAVGWAVNRHVLSYGLSYGAAAGQPVGRSGWDTDPAHCFLSVRVAALVVARTASARSSKTATIMPWRIRRRPVACPAGQPGANRSAPGTLWRRPMTFERMPGRDGLAVASSRSARLSRWQLADARTPTR